MVLRRWSACTLAVAIALAGPALALDQQLDRARQLVEQRDYLAAQDVLREIDLSQLSPQERDEHIRLMDIVGQAITHARAAHDDRAAADQAYSAGRWREAQDLYEQVLANDFAAPELKQVARVQLGRIAEKLQLSDAAMPSGPVHSDPPPARQTRPAPAPRRPAAQPVEPAQPVQRVEVHTMQAASASMQQPRPGAQRGPQGDTRSSIYTQQPQQRPPTQPPAPRATRDVQIETIDLSRQSQPPPDAQFRPQPGAQPPPPALLNLQPVQPPPPGEPMTVVEELRARDDLLWSRAVAKMQEAATLIDDAIAREDFDEARRLAEGAIQVIESSRGYAHPPSRYEEARRMALDLRDWVNRSAEESAIRRADEQRRLIAEQIEQRRIQQEQLRQEKVEQLFNTARQLEKERRFEEAAEAVRQLLAIDPTNDKARLALDFYEEFASLADQLSIEEEASRQERRVFSQTEATKIPWPDEILYPRNWLEITARRSRVGIAERVGDQDFELDRKLEEIQPEIGFVDQPFEQVVEFLADLNQVNVSVDWQDLQLNGIERDKPVTIKLRDVALGTVMQEVLAQVGGDVRLAYQVGDGLVRVATKEKLDRDKFIQVYDVRDLVMRAPRFATAPRIDLTQQARTERGSGTGATELFESEATYQSAEFDEARAARIEDGEQVAQLMDIIRQSVEPDSWRETGGGDGALRELNQQLIVYNTSDAQSQIRDLLGQLRRQRALMIAVEARFLTVASNFLEEIGVDLDFVFNAGNAGFDPAFNTQGQGLFDPFTGSRILVPRTYSRAGVFPAVPGVGAPLTPGTVPIQPYNQAGFVPAPSGVVPRSESFSPIGMNQGSLDLVDPVSLNTGIPGSIAQGANFGPALNIAGSFLDNLQVDFLIRATQASRRSSVVQAPRLMMFNGQRAWVALTRDRQYVSTVTPQVAEGAVGVTPVPATISSGSSLDVEGTISADRRYVTLTVRLGFAQEPQLDPFAVQERSGNSPGIFITLTDQERQSVNTTVSVPDGGTVLIGGLKQVGEIEMEAGVPILSKIPVLKRAFTNTTTVKDIQTLLILLKSKIIIPSEAEEEAFPTMRSVGA